MASICITVRLRLTLAGRAAIWASRLVDRLPSWVARALARLSLAIITRARLVRARVVKE